MQIESLIFSQLCWPLSQDSWVMKGWSSTVNLDWVTVSIQNFSMGLNVLNSRFKVALYNNSQLAIASLALFILLRSIVSRKVQYPSFFLLAYILNFMLFLISSWNQKNNWTFFFDKKFETRMHVTSNVTQDMFIAILNDRMYITCWYESDYPSGCPH